MNVSLIEAVRNSNDNPKVVETAIKELEKEGYFVKTQMP